MVSLHSNRAPPKTNSEPKKGRVGFGDRTGDIKMETECGMKQRAETLHGFLDANSPRRNEPSIA